MIRYHGAALSLVTNTVLSDINQISKTTHIEDSIGMYSNYLIMLFDRMPKNYKFLN
jgi:hypothetical protein